MMERKLYLAYGSNLNSALMASMCPDAEALGTAELRGYTMAFRGRPGSAFATIERASDSAFLPVMLWSIAPSDESALDEYEVYPEEYRKENIAIAFQGKIADAMVYIMEERFPYALPSGEYLGLIEAGYKALGFPMHILTRALDETKAKL